MSLNDLSISRSKYNTNGYMLIWVRNIDAVKAISEYLKGTAECCAYIDPLKPTAECCAYIDPLKPTAECCAYIDKDLIAGKVNFPYELLYIVGKNFDFETIYLLTERFINVYNLQKKEINNKFISYKLIDYLYQKNNRDIYKTCFEIVDYIIHLYTK